MHKLTTEEFIKRAKQVHNDKFEYLKTIYISSLQKVFIHCKIHGLFEQVPSKHLQGQGCPKCRNQKFSNERKINLNNFIEKARKVHGNKYDYSKVVYINSYTKICIICPVHGEFWQVAMDHIRENGCPLCSVQKRRNLLQFFITKANQIHNNKYNYSKVVYINNKTKVCIICPVHGEFWQTPSVHINDQCGCPKCQRSKGEELIEQWLIKYNINFILQFCFNECKNKRKLPFDFYLPEYNTCIEYDGEQHFKPIQFGNISLNKSFQNFQRTQTNDKIKNKFCDKKKIKLIRIPYYQKENINKILNNFFI